LRPLRAIALLFALTLPLLAAAQTDERIYLHHSDVLYKNQRDPHAEILVGHV